MRAGRLVAAAELLRKRGGRRDEAIAAYERALGLDPLQIVALDALEAMATETGDIERVAQVLGRKVAATAKRPAEQRAILGRLAALQAHLGRPDAARAAYARALELDGNFRPALAWTGGGRARARRERRGAGGARAADGAAADPAEPEASAPALARLGELYARGRARSRTPSAPRAAG